MSQPFLQKTNQLKVISKQISFRTKIKQATVSTSYSNPSAQTLISRKHDTLPPLLTKTHHHRLIKAQTPFKTDRTTKYNVLSSRKDTSGIDNFIDQFMDAQQTNLEEGSSTIPAAILKWKFEPRSQSPIDLIWFDGDPTKSPK